EEARRGGDGGEWIAQIVSEDADEHLAEADGALQILVLPLQLLLGRAEGRLGLLAALDLVLESAGPLLQAADLRQAEIQVRFPRIGLGRQCAGMQATYLAEIRPVGLVGEGPHPVRAQ